MNKLVDSIKKPAKEEIPEYVHRSGDITIRKPKFKKEIPRNVAPDKQQPPLPHVLDLANTLFNKIESGNLDHVRAEI
jgi:hypothetical protein